MSEQELLENKNQETPEEAVNVGAPARDAADHLPTKTGGRVILTGCFYGAFAIFLVAILISAFLQPGGILPLGWFFVVIFVLGAVGGGYTAFDELRHLKDALALDKQPKLEEVAILDNWHDKYVDGGIATRKTVHHISYRYANGTQYAKHSIKRSAASVFVTGKKIKVLYLEEAPEIYRPMLSE